MSKKNYEGQWRKVPTTTGVFTLCSEVTSLEKTKDTDTEGVEFYAHTNEGNKTLTYRFLSFANDSVFDVVNDFIEGDTLLIEARVYPGYLRPLLSGFWHDYREYA